MSLQLAHKGAFPRISLPVGNLKAPDIEALISMSADALRDLGGDALVVADGDPSILEAGLVLLVGDCIKYPRTADLLRSAGPDGPAAIVWQLAPLPPAFVSEEALDAGLRAAHLDARVRLPKGRIGAHLRKLMGPRTRLALKKLLLGRSLTRVARETSDGRPTSGRHRLDRGVIRSNFEDTRDQFYLELVSFGSLAWIEQATAEGWLRRVAVSTPERQGILERLGINADFVPVGYHREMGENLGLERDIDVVFLGSITNRRAEVLERIRIGLLRSGFHLVVPTRGDNCWGAKRTSLLNRTKVMVHIDREGTWEPARMRLLLGMACGAAVVSEDGADLSPLIPGRHLVTCSVENMVDTIVHYLSHESDRVALSDAATRFIQQDLRLESSLEKVLQLPMGSTP